MSKSHQLIYDDKGVPTHALVPYKDYLALIEPSVDIPEEEPVPLSVAMRVHQGEAPLRVFREWRGLSQATLSQTSGVSVSYINKIECGHLSPSPKTLLKLARSLGVESELLELPATE